MAKTVIEKDFEIACQFYSGLLSAMPQEAKDKLTAEKPEAYKMVFGDKEPEPETVQE